MTCFEYAVLSNLVTNLIDYPFKIYVYSLRLLIILQKNAEKLTKRLRNITAKEHLEQAILQTELLYFANFYNQNRPIRSIIKTLIKTTDD